ncbi:MAG: flagellar export protein FliJ [Nitrospiraceae bacterium]|nr:flagellar export protein FliJ [Nitrospiraceae bacterium]
MTSRRILRLVEWKELTREQAALEMKKSMDMLETQEQKLEELKKKLSKGIQAMNRMNSSGQINAQEVELASNYMVYLQKSIRKQEKAVSGAAAELEEKEAAFKEAYKEERALEMLHDRIRGREVKQAMVTEQKDTDFHSVIRKAGKH